MTKNELSNIAFGKLATSMLGRASNYRKGGKKSIYGYKMKFNYPISHKKYTNNFPNALFD